MQWDRKLDGRLAQALMSIPAIKAVGIGRGPDVATLPGSRIHDEIVPRRGRRAPAVGVSRPTNNAGGLEGGVTNGEDLRVTAYMKPIATLMKPLRSVDLTTLDESPGGDRAQRRLRRPRRRRRRRGHGRHRAGRRVPREVRRRLIADIARAVDASAAAIRARFRADATEPATLTGRRPPSPDDSADPQVRRRDRCTAPPLPSAITPEIERLIDDMIETMYAAPGVGLAAPQVGVPLRIFVVDVSVGRDPDGLLVFINPEFVERDGMQLEEEGCLSVPGFNATVVRPSRAVRQGPRPRRASSSSIEGTGLLARAFQHEMDHLDGTLFVDRLRGIKRDLIVRRIRKLTRAGKW